MPLLKERNVSGEVSRLYGSWDPAPLRPTLEGRKRTEGLQLRLGPRAGRGVFSFLCLLPSNSSSRVAPDPAGLPGAKLTGKEKEEEIEESGRAEKRAGTRPFPET